MPDHSAYLVFTPTTQATLNFVERPAVNDQLVDALRTPGTQVIVYGETGSGKSTLLKNKLDQLYEGHITTACTSETTFDQLMLSAFDSISPYFLASIQASTEVTIAAGLGAVFHGIKAGVDATNRTSQSETSTRAVPIQLTPERLGEFLGELGQCWVIEDFHKVAPDEKQKLAQCLKVFCDLAQRYQYTKIVAIGATATAREVIQYDPEMANRVGEIEVPLMTDAEITAIIEGGEKYLNVDFSAIRDSIIAYSMGVASICHQLCLNICTSNDVYSTANPRVSFDDSHLQIALKKYVRDTSDTLKSHFDVALKRYRVVKYDNARLILSALVTFPFSGALFGEILTKIREDVPDYPTGGLTNYLQRLQLASNGGIVRCDHENRYRFVDAFHHLYAFLSLNRRDEGLPLPDSDLSDHLLKELLEILERNIVRTKPSSSSSGSSSDQLILWPPPESDVRPLEEAKDSPPTDGEKV